MKNEVYLDNAATTHIHPDVLKHLIHLYEKGIGNSSSIHHSGVLASIELEKAKAQIAGILNCSPEEVYFTSGATESNNLILKGLFHNVSSGDEVILSTIEHSSISQVADYLSTLGVIVKKVSVSPNGIINISQLEKLISPRTKIVSIMHANNEIGVIQDLEKIGKLCKEKNVLFHSDGAQAFCKTAVDVKKMNLDSYSMSGHKIHAPKGIGALYIKRDIKLSPQLHGGKQESGIRPGTVPVELASAMAEATRLFTKDTLEKVSSLKRELIGSLSKQFGDLRIHGDLELSLPNIINFAIPNHQGKRLLRELDKAGIRISVGSACNSGQKNPSHVLTSLGLSTEEAYEAIRVSFGINTSADELKKFEVTLTKILAKNDPT